MANLNIRKTENEMALFESGTQAARALTTCFAGCASAMLCLPKLFVGKGREIPSDVSRGMNIARTIFDESIQSGAAAAAWARHSGTPLAIPGVIADMIGHEAMRGIDAGKLNHAVMLTDLLILLNQGPTAIVVGDTVSQLT